MGISKLNFDAVYWIRIKRIVSCALAVYISSVVSPNIFADETNGSGEDPPVENSTRKSDTTALDLQRYDLAFSSQDSRATDYDASDSFVINGSIKDAETGESIPYASIREQGTNNSTSANQQGIFAIFDVGSNSVLEISKVGYTPFLLDFSNSPDRRFFEVKLLKQDFRNSQSLEEIVVVGNQTQRLGLGAISSFTLTPELTEVLPSMGEKDIFRSLQLLPGISGSNESSSGLIVRGGTSDQNLILFDGYPVYHVDHLFGFFSAFNNNAIKDVQMIKGGFDAKYGGRLSSVVDITGKDGNSEEYNIGGSIGLLSGNVFLESPFSDGAGSVILTARKSYESSLYNDILDSVSGTDPVSSQTRQVADNSNSRFGLGRVSIQPSSFFYDANAKLTYRLDNEDKISLSLYKGEDELDNSRVSSGSNAGRVGRGGQEFGFDRSTTDLSQWGNTGLSAKYTKQWSGFFSTDLVLSHSNYFRERERQVSTNIVFLDDQEISDDDQTRTPGNNNSIDDNNLSDTTISVNSELLLDGANRLGFGFQVTENNVDYLSVQGLDNVLVDSNQEAITTSIFLQDEIDVTDRLVVNAGMRLSYYDLVGDFYLEPRLSLSYSITDQANFKAAFGAYNQFATRVVRQSAQQGEQNFWIMADGEDIKPSKATHYIIGLSYDIKNYRFDVEAYRKDYEGLTEFTQQFVADSDGTNRSLILDEKFFTGTGEVTGLELFAQRKFGDVTGWASYTYSEVLNNFPAFGDQPYYADQDSTHEFKAVATYNWGDWDFSSTFVYATGKPYTDVLGYEDDGINPAYFQMGEKNGVRYDDYHRFDVAGTYSFNFRGSEGKLGFSLFNIYDRKNQWYTEFEIVEGEILETDVNYLGITPSLFINWKLR